MQKVAVAFSMLLLVALMGVTAFFMFQRKSPTDDVFGPPWAPYTSAVGQYTINFLHRPNESWTDDARPPVTHVAHAALVHDDDADEEYDVEFTRLAKVVDVEKELDAAIDAFVGGKHDWTVTSRSKITLDGKHPGRAATVKIAYSKRKIFTAKIRAYIVVDRRYLLVCSAVRDDANVARFLDSFKLLK